MITKIMGGVIGCRVSDFSSARAAERQRSRRSLTVSHSLRDLVHVISENKQEITMAGQNNKAFLTSGLGHGLMVSFTTRQTCHDDSNGCWVLLELIL